MAHNPAWLVNKHPNNLKAQIKELVQKGYSVTLQDVGSAQLMRKKSFSCLFALMTGVLPYALYYMAKQDYTVYLDVDTQKPDPSGITQEPSPAVWLFKVAAIAGVGIFMLVAVSTFVSGITEGEIAENIEPIIDAPHILGLTIEEARAELGTPNDGDLTDPTKQQITMGTTTWNNSFTINDYSIVLDYDVQSRNVTAVFIASDDPSGATRDWKPLVALIGASQGADGYSIQPVEALSEPGHYTGVEVTDK